MLSATFVLAFTFTGCDSGGGGTAIDNADESAIEAYQRGEAEDQARLNSVMDAPNTD